MSELKKRYYPKLKEELYYATLENGLKLYIIQKKGFVEKAAFFSTNFGAIDNSLQIGQEKTIYPSGLAHFIEHKLFETEQGKDVTNDFINLGVDVNAFTSLERTTYYFSTIDNFDEALERLQNFTSKLTVSEESVEREKSIIEQEIKMYLDDPDYRSYLGCLQSLYPNTPLSQDIAGSVESLSQLSIKDLEENYDYFYRPKNCQLVLVGDFDVNLIYDSVKKTQEKLTSSTLEVQRDQAPIVATIEKKDGIQMDVSVAKLAVGFKTPSYSPSRMRDHLLTQLLFNLLFGWTSPYYQKWYAEGKIDETLSIDFEVSKRYAFVILTMDTPEPIRMSSLLRQVMTSADKKELLTEESLELQKNAIYGDFLRSFDNIQLVGSQFLSFLDDESTYFDLGKELMAITLSEVKAFASHYFSHMETSDFVVFPK